MVEFTPPSSGVRVQIPHGGIIEKHTGKTRHEWKVEDLITLFRKLELKIICLMYIGGDGQLRVLDFAPRDDEHLRDILFHGERADGSSIFKGLGIDSYRSDIVLRPRIDTAFIEPFTGVPALAVLCDHLGRNGLLLPVSPSTILRRATERFREVSNDAELWSLGELEYFAGVDVSTVFKPYELERLNFADEGGYHAASPQALFVELRRKVISVLADIGVPVKYAHGEVGLIPPSNATKGIAWEQHEIELALAPLMEAADALVLTKWVVSSVAKQLHANISYEPMLLEGHAGSGLHQHMSIVHDGVHLAHANPNGSMSDSTSWLISGLLELGGALMCLGNRVEDSFLRLTQGKEAPKGVFWGYLNRGSMIRLPVQVLRRTGSGDNGNDETVPVTPATVEYRLGDGSAFPHLLLAGIAQAATLGSSTPRAERMGRIISGAATAFDARAAGATTTSVLSKDETFATSPVPLSMSEIAAELKRCQDSFCAGGVFPEETMSAIRAALLQT